MQPLDPEALAKRRRVAFGIVGIVVLAITGGHLYEGLKEHGPSAEAIVPPVLGLILIAGIFAGIRHAQRRSEAQPGGTTPAAARRRRNVLVALGVGGACLSALATVGQTLTAPRLDAPKFHAEGSRVSSTPLGLAFTLPAPWEPMTLAGQPDLDFAAQHAPSGTFFTGNAVILESREASLDATLREVLEGRRKKWGQLLDEQWGDDRVGGTPARTLAITVQRPDGRVRSKLWLLHKGPYGASFTCAGPSITFGESEKQCRMVLDGVEAR
jgi:hypothetical protein